MKSLGDQMSILLNRRFSQVSEKAGLPFLKEVFERMKELTRGGKTFKNLLYQETYSNRRTRERKKMGLQVHHVDLRAKNRRIEIPEYNRDGANYEVGFQHGGNIFYEHQNAIGRNPYREIFPRAWDNVPDDIKQNLRKRVANIMNGRNV